MKQIMHGTLAKNEYCVYRQAVVQREGELAAMTDPAAVRQEADEALGNGEYQSAQLALERLLALVPGDTEALDRLGFAHFQMENYAACRETNRRALELNPGNAYAHKGMGLCLARLGEVDAGVEHLRRAIDIAPDFLDARHDLAVVLVEAERKAEAAAVLDEAGRRSTEFAETHREMRATLES
jgi:tetratricopeptide (TPR) repeat protein